MWQFMESHHSSVFVTSYEGGIARVKRGNYAFLMESTMLDYVVQVVKISLLKALLNRINLNFNCLDFLILP